MGYEYRIEHLSPVPFGATLADEINEIAAQGWRLHTIAESGRDKWDNSFYLCVFEKVRIRTDRGPQKVTADDIAWGQRVAAEMGLTPTEPQP